jgi:hypothetical protein
MNFSGTLITLEIAADGLVLKVVSFYATAVRTLTGTDHNNCQDVILDIKGFTISGDIVDGMILNSYLNCHGEIIIGEILKSLTWHGKEFKMYGNFLTELKSRPKDPVTSS